MTRLTAVRVAYFIAASLLAADKYSWGSINPPFGILGDAPVGVHRWQAVIALALIGLLTSVVISAVRRPRVAFNLAFVELVAFIAFNATLIARDGLARLAEWGYAETSTGLYLLVGGVITRGVAIRLLSVGQTEQRLSSASGGW